MCRSPGFKVLPMGLILDSDSAKFYESWLRSSQGRAVEKMADASLRAMLEPHPGERILDIGCGDGTHLLLCSRLGVEPAGVDASPYMIARARERFGNRATLRTANAEELPFEDNEFDLAVLINTLEFLDDPLPALREAGRVARRKVFIGVMNRYSWHCLCARLKGLFRETLFNHLKFYDLWELQSCARAVFGEAPMSWGCARMKPEWVARIGGPLNSIWNWKHCPFGIFLCLSVSLMYTVQTEQHPLKVSLGKAGPGVINGVTSTRSSGRAVREGRIARQSVFPEETLSQGL